MEKHPDMVRWYNLGQLFDTGLKTLLSTIIGKHSDRRLIEALASRRKEFYDYTCHYKDLSDGPEIDLERPRKEIWIDYISDTADGWNSTYAVAYYATQPILRLKDHDTCRGAVLIFGGDEVYPAASRRNYRDRLLVPFAAAFGAEAPEERPHVFAIPGNHDWYDSLDAFTRLFCSDLRQRTFAGWRTRQRRSYFALKLPGRWWLLGSDGQLQSELDTPQVEYFRYIADKYMEEGDRVILCIAEPVWILAHKYKKYSDEYDESDLLFLQEEILSKKNIPVKLFLSGDFHHYRRHEEDAPDPAQKIIAGGGGAFLHPTHGEDVSLLAEKSDLVNQKPRRFLLKQSYPEIEVSRKLGHRNLFFLWLNPWFGLLTGSVYLLTAWAVASQTGYKKPDTMLECLRLTAAAFAKNPSLFFWIMFLVAMMVFFTDTHSRFYKWAGGLLHCLAHFLALFYLGWGSVILCQRFLTGYAIPQFALAAILIFGSGWVAGSFLMGLYLLISLNLFGRHSEEAFSSLRIEDYKNFLRMHIAEDGTLTVYPIKIEEVPRKWKKSEPAGTASYYKPQGGSAPDLIEPPIRIG